MSCFNFRILTFTALLLATLVAPTNIRAETREDIAADLLIVGGTESGWAAAIQAARMGVSSIVIVHDGEWLGGQFTEQGLACVDENKGVAKVGWGPDWHPMKRAFHRSGLFKELMDRIEALNDRKYGDKMPGRPAHGPTTFRPAEAEAIFREMLQPYLTSGQVRLMTGFVPIAAFTSEDAGRLTGMKFRSLRDNTQELSIRASFTIDASDWGDAVQLSGAAFEVGADPRSRYGEPSAQVDVSSNPPNEMNPLTWAMIVEESADWSPIPQPPRYDERRYWSGSSFAQRQFRELAWDRPAKGSAISPWPAKGKVAARQSTIYTMRRIVEGTTSADSVTSILLCYSHGQDYPLERLPRHIADALEATERGASLKNIVLMTRPQRQIIFDDVKAHSLGLLHHLQTFAHEHAADTTHSLRKFHLSTEFGTPDHLPPKPYIRESLRLKALYMMREQDGRNMDGPNKNAARESFAHKMYPDGVLCWQFHYDFHNTGRAYLQSEGDTGPWTDYEKPGRGTHVISDRCVLPLRSLIPERMDGLLGAQGNLGFSSIVSAAVRLHDQRIHIGQAAAATAALCLKHQLQPRDIAWDRARLDELQHALCGGTDGVPMLLWPYRDLPADHPAFIAINRLAARLLLPMSRREVDFQPDAPATDEWRKEVLKLCVDYDFNPILPAGTRAGFLQGLWPLIQSQSPPAWSRLQPNDADADSIPDTHDPLPFSSAGGSWPNE